MINCERVMEQRCQTHQPFRPTLSLILTLLLCLTLAGSQTPPTATQTYPSEFYSSSVSLVLPTIPDSDYTLLEATQDLNVSFLRSYKRNPQIILGLYSIHYQNFYANLTGGVLHYGMKFKSEVTRIDLNSFTIRTFRANNNKTLTFMGIRYLIYDRYVFEAKYPQSMIVNNLTYNTTNSTLSTETLPSIDINTLNVTQTKNIHVVLLISGVTLMYSKRCHTYDLGNKVFQSKFGNNLTNTSLVITWDKALTLTGNCNASTVPFDNYFQLALSYIICDISKFKLIAFFDAMHLILAPATFADVNSSFTNMNLKTNLVLMGLREFSFNTNAESVLFNFADTISYDLGKNTISSTISISNWDSTAPYYFSYFSTSVLIMTEWTCRVSNPFLFDTSSNKLCYDNCPPGTATDATLKRCINCINLKCLYCDSVNLNLCIECDETQNRTLSNGDCIAKKGFYDGGTQISPCVNPQCLQCDDGTSCTKCSSDSYQNGTQPCVLCNDAMQGCSVCNAFDFCTACATGYILRGNSICTIACKTSGCYKCTTGDDGNEICLKCNLFGYTFRNGQCSPLCGDGVIVPDIESCDDFNTLNFDGCSSTCQIEPGCKCDNITSRDTRYKSTSNCTYFEPPFFKLQSIIKIKSANQIQLSFTLPSSYAHLYARAVNDLPKIISINGKKVSPFPAFDLSNTQTPSSVKAVVSNLPTSSSDTTMMVTVEYLEDLQDQNLTVSFDFSLWTGIYPIFAQTPTVSSTFAITPTNNQLASFYTLDAYSNQSLVEILCYASAGLSLIAFLVSLFLNGKLIAVEMLGIVQFSYLSLLAIMPLNPVAVGLLPLSFSNGFNQISTLMSNDSSQTILLNGLKMHISFILNFNLSAAFIILPLLIALILFILSKVPLSEEKKQKCGDAAQRILIEFSLIFGLFCAYLIVFAFWCQVKYSMQDLSAISLVFGILMMLFLVFCCVISVKKFDLTGEIYKSIKSACFESKYLLILFVERILNATLLIMLVGYAYQNAISLSIFGGLLLLFLIKKPYRELKDNIRIIANYLIQVLIQACFLIIRVLPQDKSTQGLQIQLPFTIAALVLLAVFINTVYLMRKMYKFVKGTDKLDKLKPEDLLEFKSIQQKAAEEDPDEAMKKCREELYGGNVVKVPIIQNPQNHQTNLHEPEEYTSTKIKNLVQKNKTGENQRENDSSRDLVYKEAEKVEQPDEQNYENLMDKIKKLKDAKAMRGIEKNRLKNSILQQSNAKDKLLEENVTTVEKCQKEIDKIENKGMRIHSLDVEYDEI